MSRCYEKCSTDKTKQSPVLEADDLEVPNLRPGEAVDTTTTIPTVITLPDATSASIRRTRSGRRITPPSRFRDAALMTINGTQQFSIFDNEDELDEDFHDYHDIGAESIYHSGSLFAHPVTLPPLRRDVYGLTATHLQRCEDLVSEFMNTTTATNPTEATPPELSLVGATGTAFKHTTDLHVKKFKRSIGLSSTGSVDGGHQ